MKKQPRFGRIPSVDPDDHKYLMRRLLAPVGMPLPTRKTWRINGTALNQNATGTCVSHAGCNFLRAAPIQSNAGIDAFRWVLYDECTLLDEWPENDRDTKREMGTSVRALMKALTNRDRLKSYLWAFELQPAVEWVLTQGPVILGTNWYQKMMSPNKEGIVTITPGTRPVGGHAYLWRGVDTKRALAKCSNSWGDSWGVSGDFYIGLRDLERLIHEDGEVATAVEQRLRAKK